MRTASLVLIAIGALGAFDIAWFHRRTCNLQERTESRLEAWIHVVRGLIYTLQFALVPTYQFHGAWYVAFAALFCADVTIAMLDVAIEPASRKSQGGLPAGEYLAHIVLSVLVGIELHAIAMDSAAWIDKPSAIVHVPVDLPSPLRALLALMAVSCALATIADIATLVDLALPSPPPVHVSLRVRAGLRALWDLTQDHGRHPEWDHRFTRIVMLADQIETGTTMQYERTVLGLTIRGSGRYKLHRPCSQSTFEFWSHDPRSLIRRGVGLWLYRPGDDGTIEFSTSYTYAVRWGTLGRWLDRLVLRPFMQFETERSFRRLSTCYFAAGSSPVAGAHGRKRSPLQAVTRAMASA